MVTTSVTTPRGNCAESALAAQVARKSGRQRQTKAPSAKVLESVAPRSRFQDLPHNILLQCVEFMPVREVLLLGTLNRFFHTFTGPRNIPMWKHFTERVYLQHPPALREALFNEPLLRIYAAVHSLSALPSPVGTGPMEDHDPLEMKDVPRTVITPQELHQWVADHCEEVLQDLRLFADVIHDMDSRYALTGLLLALQTVKKRMWYTELRDFESVRDLLRATVVEEGHDRGWAVLRTIAKNRVISRRVLASFVTRTQPRGADVLNWEQRLLKRRWRKAATVAREYMQLRDVLRVALAVSEVSDHTNAQQRYDSAWSAVCGTTAMLNAEVQRFSSQSGDPDEVGTVIPMHATNEGPLSQIRDLSKATVGGIVSYFFGYVCGKAQRKTFLAALFSMEHLAGAEGFEGTPFW